MQHQILAHPAHYCAEDQEDKECSCNNHKGTGGVMHHYFIDDDLGADRDGQPYQLNGERSQQDL
jgi:hypothetical protein